MCVDILQEGQGHRRRLLRTSLTPAVWELREMGDAEVDRVQSFVRGMWALTTTSLVAYTSRHGLTKKECEGAGTSSQMITRSLVMAYRPFHIEQRGPRPKTL